MLDNYYLIFLDLLIEDPICIDRESRESYRAVNYFDSYDKVELLLVANVQVFADKNGQWVGRIQDVHLDKVIEFESGIYF